jgi:micrococcal nuclease
MTIGIAFSIRVKRKMYEYKCRIVKIVDGDTVDVDIDLGFGIWVRDERVRVHGIDTPESRTRDKIEKKFGLASKKYVQNILKKGSIQTLVTQKPGDEAKGKFGRILGKFKVYDNVTDSWMFMGDIMVREGYAVPYQGGSKDKLIEQHLANRNKLIAAGVVTL